jgi:hypothetical protein
MLDRWTAVFALFLATSFGCGGGVDAAPEHAVPGGSSGDHSSGGAGGSTGGAGGPQAGCPDDVRGCYTVYAHSDHVLYHIDLVRRSLVTVGPFRAPSVNGGGGAEEDVITDLAVKPDGSIYVISKTNLYTANAMDGHVTPVGSVTACGEYAVAMTFGPDGVLYTADYHGAFCKIDLSRSPPSVQMIGNLGGGLALSGDLVAVGDGTIFGTAYRLSDRTDTGTQENNLLVRLDPASGRVTQTMGQTGFPKLFGIAYNQGRVFGFTHDGTGHVVTIDPSSGQAALYGTFMDPATQRGISFAGAGVNAMVPIVGLSLPNQTGPIAAEQANFQ